MNTATNRVRAGSLPPLQLHRAQPLDFVMSDDEEQEVRDGYDMAMKAPIVTPDAIRAAEKQRLDEYHRGMTNALPRQEADVETVEQFDTDTTEIAWVGWLLIACLLCVISSGLGYLAGRYFS